MAALAYFVTTLRAKFEEREKGAAAVEYGLIIGLVSIGLVVAALALSGSMNGIYTSIQTWLGSQTVGATPVTPGG
ncbi:Flp family type IVb pilin [Ornithinimicrobium faecis]|uniref:Flp family type IVb pilin n=1 Tax=Ornithinimicrobium faecis TaxID=2934158 RepID=UPI002119112B|nr:Flp family type IVb pilin [Ornithinimicrobium sp. HY1745]